MKIRPCQSYNDCPNYFSLKSENPYILLGECQCGIRKYKRFRNFYWKIYPYIISPFLKVDEQEWVMMQIEKQYD